MPHPFTRCEEAVSKCHPIILTAVLMILLLSGIVPRLAAQHTALEFHFRDGTSKAAQLLSVRDSCLMIYSGSTETYAVLQDTAGISRIPLESISLVTVESGAEFWDGFLTGFAIAGAAGLVISALSVEWYDTDDESPGEDLLEGFGNLVNVLYVGLITGLSGLTGGLIGGAIASSGEKWLYSHGGETDTLKEFAVFPDEEPPLLQQR
ncbi:MAG: hypothetical protein JXA28_11955 [Bacteroidetes bacterium]|nr:hypothetical protein [Bacteroidota bacterium]